MHAVARLAVSATVLVVTLAAGSAACGAPAEGLPLFRDTTRQPTVPPPQGPTIVRTRYAEIDFDALGGTGVSPAAAAPTVRLNLFPDASFVAERDRAEPTSSGQGLVWIGRLHGRPDSTVTLVAEDGVLAGTVQVGARLFRVRYAGDGVHAIDEVDQAAFPRD